MNLLENIKKEFVDLIDEIINCNIEDEELFKDEMNNILDRSLDIRNSLIPLIISKHTAKFGNEG